MMIKEIEDFVRQNLDPDAVIHTFRVRDLALRIAKREGADKEIVEIAALLHDIGLIKAYKSHDRWGAPIARHYLEKRGFDLVKIGKIVNCILTHSGNGNPETLEQKIIYDADSLEKLGALGVVRLAVNQMKYRLFKPVDIPNQIVKKKVECTKKLYTITAKIMAKSLIKFDKEFMKQLKSQLKAMKEE